MYERDIFYDVRKLSLDKKIEILNAAKLLCKEYWVDKLDCNISWARQRIDMSFDEVMKLYNPKCHTVVIYRKGSVQSEYYGEIGFTTMSGVNFYLWIILTVDNLMNLVEKHKLKPQA